MSQVRLEDARRVIAAAEKKAAQIGQPMNIAVADEGGNIVAHVRMDGAWIGSIDISQKKAYTSRAFDITTKDLATHSQSGGQFFGIHASNDGKIMIFAGGIPLKREGKVVGAIGVSGGSGDQDHAVANAGIFLVKPFTEYTAEDFRALVSTNLAGFIYIAQLAVKQMQAQKSGGSIVSISAALADNPIAGVPASVPMITKGGLNAVIGSLALEYAKEHIRFNAVAPGVVDTPLHADDSSDVLKTLSPMGTISTVEEIASAAVYLTEARQITGEVLRVDGGAHVGKW